MRTNREDRRLLEKQPEDTRESSVGKLLVELVRYLEGPGGSTFFFHNFYVPQHFLASTLRWQELR